MGDTWVGGCGTPEDGRNMVEVCSVCEGSGLRILLENGHQVARPCECRVERRVARALERSGIPKRYAHCSLENYESGFAGADRTLWAAQMRAKRFVDGYPIDTSDTGLMFVGSIGVGKTHLAVSVLRRLMIERGATGLFCDYRDLLKKVQDSYNPGVAATEMQVLRPVFEAEILLLDELGASKPSEWVWDTVAHILNTRYNERRMTIITTNFADAAPLGTGVPYAETNASGSEPSTDDGKRAKAAMRDDTLGDRIGERMRSRLHEMCVVIEMYGKDFRKNVKHAHFATDTRGPDESKVVQGGAATGSMPPKTRICEHPIATPALEQEDPLSGRIRTTGKKLAVATPELKVLTEAVKNSTVPQVWVNGAPEPMLTWRGTFAGEPHESPDEPPLGRAKMGKSATPQPKRLVDNDWREG